MTDTTKERALADLAKQMGDEGYCNYAACQEYLAKAYRMGAEQSTPHAHKSECLRCSKGVSEIGTPSAGVRWEITLCDECNEKFREFLGIAAEQSTPANWEGRAEIAKLKQENAGLRERLAAEQSTETPPMPIQLNDEQENCIKIWAADDRCWSTQETTEFNLRTFARKIIGESVAEAPRPVGTPEGK